MCVNNGTSNITLSCLILEGSNKMHQGGIIKISLNRGGESLGLKIAIYNWTIYQENPEMDLVYKKCRYHENAEYKVKYQNTRYQENPETQMECKCKCKCKWNFFGGTKKIHYYS